AHMGFVLIGFAAFTSIGISGAVLQMISHGLIAAVMFFLSGVAYERAHTLDMTKLGGMARKMPVAFAFFTAAAMASLALPGMSGFVSEIAVFLGMATSDAYTLPFKISIIVLAAIGVILSPVYLLTMLRRIFYGDTGEVIEKTPLILDIRPREVFIAACLLVPVIGIGLYPNVATQTYDAKTMAVLNRVQDTMMLVADRPAQPMFSAIASPERMASLTAPTIIE
ncbi:MAG: proton-conducting transporter membrane subunit, partial [Cyanobacteria bacterium P01_D01_bin.71]